MVRFHNTFLGYRVYRKKFLGTAAVVLLLCIAAFTGMLIFLVHSWMYDLRQQTQNIFMERERRLANIETWTLDYTDRLYRDQKLMEDLQALFQAADEQEYLWRRRNTSLNTTEQISYLPADAKRMFVDKRSKVTGITLYTPNGMKVLWLENGDMQLSFDYQSAEELRTNPYFGDVMAGSYEIRNPAHLDEIIGSMDFWISSEDLYEPEIGVAACWGVFQSSGERMTDNAADERQEEWLRMAASEGRASGWLEVSVWNPVFFAKHTSSRCDYSYVVVKDVRQMLRDNSHVVLALAGVFILIAVVVMTGNYINVQKDANFLSIIMGLLSNVEEGNFQELREKSMPDYTVKNEYGMIALAIKDVGAELEGYIETEYILKLKEQETEMRALQHQINPHFLYNTLEMLRSMALTHGDTDMGNAIAMLGTLYRTRMHKKETIPLKEEFHLLEMYLKIMAFRFGDSFVYQVELEDEIAGLPTLTFWLQPLAENYFVHGIDRESEYNLLLVSGRAEGDGARIEMIDNGCGVRPELLEETRRNMYEGNDDPEADIGLRNVFIRMNYFYRDGFTMDIGNNTEGGFYISIFIPGKVEKDVHTGDRG